MKILIVDDDAAIQDNLELIFKLTWPDSVIVLSKTGQEAINVVETERPDLLILDLGLPDINGFEVIKRIRLFSSIPILVLTVKNEEWSVVKAFGLGADEYIAKPFRPMELLVRVRCLMKKLYSISKSCVNLGPYIVDFATARIQSGRETIRLTIIEAAILYFLLLNTGHYVSTHALSTEVWGDDYSGNQQALRVHIRNLRRKIEPDPKKPKYILNKPYIGYMIPEIWIP